MHCRFPSIHPIALSFLGIQISLWVLVSCAPSPRYVSSHRNEASDRASREHGPIPRLDSVKAAGKMVSRGGSDDDSSSLQTPGLDTSTPPGAEHESVIVWKERGIAAWYGQRFNKRKTASGELFDSNKFTAAHKSLPFNTLIKVTNLGNGLSVVVRINDRGPFEKNRIIDLSRAAAKVINLNGIGTVVIERIQEPTP